MTISPDDIERMVRREMVGRSFVTVDELVTIAVKVAEMAIAACALRAIGECPQRVNEGELRWPT